MTTTPRPSPVRAAADAGTLPGMDMTLKNAKDVSTGPLVAVGLIGGWLTARETGIRPIGGAVLGAVGAWCARTWFVRDGAAAGAALTAAYVGAFGLSHPLAKKIGSWPAVLAVTAAAAAPAFIADARNS